MTSLASSAEALEFYMSRGQNHLNDIQDAVHELRFTASQLRGSQAASVAEEERVEQIVNEAANAIAPLIELAEQLNRATTELSVITREG